MRHCQFCWAYHHSEKCIANPENKPLLCQRAKARMKAANKTSIKERVESPNVKKYLKYISKRIAYLKMLMGRIPTSEYKYYCALQEAVKEWGKAHVLFYGCLCGKLTVAQASSICGVSQSTFFRLMRKQKQDLIGFIEKQEDVLSEKYPFIPMADILEE